jgi:hypothetical protein
MMRHLTLAELVALVLASMLDMYKIADKIRALGSDKPEKIIPLHL